MKRIWIVLVLLPLLQGACGEEDVSTESTDGQIVLHAGINAVAITRFPNRGLDGGAEELTLPFVFGEANEAGLQSGEATTADIVWIHTGLGKWAKFFYGEVLTPFGDSEPEWRNIANPARDASDFTWPYTAGMLIERRSKKPLVITVKGAIKRTPSILLIQNGTNYFNRILDGPLFLAELRLEEFFVRAPEDLIFEMVVDNPGGPRPGPVPPRLEADLFLDPESGRTYVLSEKGKWFELGTRNDVDPTMLLVPGTFGVERIGNLAKMLIEPPLPVVAARPVKLLNQPFLGLGEGAVRALRVEDIGPTECNCALLLHDNRPIALHVIESATGSAIVRVGKHPDNVVTDAIAIANGQGFIGKLDNVSNLFRVERSVRSFSGSGPIEEPKPFVVKLPDPERREGEWRFFSQFDPEGRLVLFLDKARWQAESLLEIDLVALTPSDRKIALHLPRLRLVSDAGSDVVAEELAGFLRLALIERDLVPADQIQISVRAQPDGGALLIFDFGRPLEMGKVDLCLLPPPVQPKIDSSDDFVVEGGLIEILGKDFGRRIDDLCIVLAPADGVGSSIPLRPVSLSPDGTRILARVVGPISDGRVRQVMLARGIGRTRPIHLGFSDVIVRQATWVWRGNGADPVVSPNIVQPVLAQGEIMHFAGNLVDGSLELTIDQPWPENAEVSISFTANTDSVQLDAYAPELCFTVSGSTEECAERLQRVIEAAFVQGGMANANQVQVELNVAGDEVTLTANVFTEDGVKDPITSGHLNVSVSGGDDPCAPPPPVDSDGDLIQDTWESDHFEMQPLMVDALGDADTDDVLNHAEFAFATDPFVKNDMTPLTISLDEDGHPMFVYQRHVAAANFYHFDIETSLDGDHWERLANLETLSIIPVGLGLPVETIVTRCLVAVEDVTPSFFRLRLSPRS